MILTLYVTFTILALCVLGVGVFLGENYFSFIGLFFLFLLGSNLLFNGVDYESGTTVTTAYNYVNGTVNSSSTSLSYDYTNFKDDTITKWFGFFIAIASGFGLGAILTQARRDYKERYEKLREFGE